jgi:hypothetical protein
MRTLIAALFIFGLSVILPKAPMAMATAAQLRPQSIHRCIGRDGEPVFTAKPCVDESLVMAPALAGSAAPAGPSMHVCPLSPQELRDRVAAALQEHDVNKLAGLMLWNGDSQRAAVDVLRRLASLVRQPVNGLALAPVSADVPTSASVPASASTVGASEGALQLNILAEDGSSTTFALSDSGGCWWLHS